MRLLILTLATALASSAVMGQGLNNGNFDGTPSYGGWEIAVVGADIANQATGGNPGGYVWLNHSGGATDPSASQTLNGLKPGTTYAVRGDYKGGKNVHLHYLNRKANTFSVDIDGNSIAKMSLPQEDPAAPARTFDALYAWMPFQATFTATKPTHVLRFRAEVDGADGDVCLDNVSVTPSEVGVAEPIMSREFFVNAFSVNRGKDLGLWFFGFRTDDVNDKTGYIVKVQPDGTVKNSAGKPAQKMDIVREDHGEDVYAFRVVNYPGASAAKPAYLTARADGKVVIEMPADGKPALGAKFGSVGAFTAEKGAAEYRSFESKLKPGSFLRHRGHIMFIDPKPTTFNELYNQDSSWKIEAK